MQVSLFFLLLILGTSLASENGSDISALQQELSALKQENARLKALLDGNTSKRSNVAERNGELTQSDACKCHYCSETDNPIKAEHCTDCDGFCDMCDFCSGDSPIISAAKCATECEGGGYTPTTAPAPEVCTNPIVTYNAVTICEPLFTSTPVDNNAISSYAPKETNNNIWRWVGIRVQAGYTATLRAVYLSAKYNTALSMSPFPDCQIHGGIWKATYTANYPGEGEASLTKTGQMKNVNIKSTDTTRAWHRIEPMDGPLTLEGGTNGHTYFYVYIDRWGGTGPNYPGKNTFFYQKAKPGLITVPTGVTDWVGRRTLLSTTVPQTSNWDSITLAQFQGTAPSSTDEVYQHYYDISAKITAP